MHAGTKSGLLELMEPTPERRSAQRLNLRIPLVMKVADGELPAFTRDISARGVSFYLESEPAELRGEEIEFVITFPPEITMSTSLHVRCHARVVRQTRSEIYGVGVAAEINHYEFLSVAHA